MRSAEISRLVAKFWTGAGGRERYGRPIAIEEAVAFALRVAVLQVANLTFGKADEILKRIGGPQTAPGGNEKLHGLIVADQGIALAFVEAEDSPEEQRVTIAHETAHFLRHYLYPRQRARDILGSSIDDVLSRRRLPSATELLGAALKDVPLGCFRHGDFRQTGLSPRERQIEDEADLIASELLIPAGLLRSLKLYDPTSVSEKFGVTLGFAELAVRLARPPAQAPNVIDLLRRGAVRKKTLDC